MTKLIKILFRRQLVSFGNYLLSSQRDKMIRHESSRSGVGHWDIENWN